MARTANPQYSTYSTKQFGFVREVFARNNASTDALYINCFIEGIKQGDKVVEQAVVKRPGTTTIVGSGSFGGRVVRGIHYWQDRNVLLVFADADLLVFGPTGNLITTVATGVSTTTGDVGFTEYLYPTGITSVIFSTGTQLGEISTAYSVTLSTDPDLPSPHDPNICTLDGYIFLVKKDSQDIYNSDLDQPLSFTAGEFISAEMSPDGLVKVAQLSNYLVAFGTQGLEYFYDAANASGSPLSRNDTFFKNVGYLGGLAKLGNKLFFIGKDLNGLVDVYQVEDSKVSPLNDQQFLRFLEQQTDFTTCYGTIMSYNGVEQYIVTIGNRTWVINPQTQFVTEFKYKNLDTFPIKYSSTGVNLSTGALTFMYIPDDNAIVKFNHNVFTDSGTNYTYEVRTQNNSFDTMQIKIISRLSLFADWYNTTATLMFSWSDDDYKTFSTPVPLYLGQELPSVRRLGGFRRRAFRFVYTGDQPVRLYGYELDLNLGS